MQRSLNRAKTTGPEPCAGAMAGAARGPRGRGPLKLIVRVTTTTMMMMMMTILLILLLLLLQLLSKKICTKEFKFHLDISVQRTV